MIDRLSSGERVILVHLDLGGTAEPDEREEFALLASAAGALVVGALSGSRKVPDARLFIGSGKAMKLKDLVAATGAELAVFAHPLSPAQERNLERLLECRVVDRTGLILDIFAQRARSFEGKLQVELAQLRHLSTRLVRGWTHLERQKGGIGLRGPGETQLETDRRLLAKRIALLNQRLDQIQTQRAQGRRARDKAELSVISLVGYTNAGKSTLFNRLTESGVYEADQLFATLDPTLRRLALPDGGRALLADTVGFVSRLPHELVAAFRATLEETRNAALLLHVVDASVLHRARLIADVETVLAEIGSLGLPRLEVWNKIDLLDDEPPRLERNAAGIPVRIWLSAASGAGIELLLAAVAELIGGARSPLSLLLGPQDARLRAWIYAHAGVLADEPDDLGGSRMEILIALGDLRRLAAQAPGLADQLGLDERGWVDEELETPDGKWRADR